MKAVKSREEWYTDSSQPFPPCFTKRSVGLMPKIHESEKGKVIYLWNENIYSHIEWNEKWSDKAFPNLKRKDGSTPNETTSHRTTSTIDAKNIEFCWSNLKRINFPSDWTGPSRSLGQKFRVDMYGNVVSKESSNESLTKFDVDHIFPWSKGGRSVQANFAGVQCVANRYIKSDCLVQLLKPEDMACGLQIEQFLSLIKYLNAKELSRKDNKSIFDRLEYYLCASPNKGESFTSFQSTVRRSIDGATLWKFFLERDQEKLRRELQLEGSIMTSSTLTRDTSVDIRMFNNNRLECFGRHTYAIRAFLKDSLHMSWDSGRKVWFILFSGHDIDVMRSFEEACAFIRSELWRLGIAVNMSHSEELKVRGRTTGATVDIVHTHTHTNGISEEAIPAIDRDAKNTKSSEDKKSKHKIEEVTRATEVKVLELATALSIEERIIGKNKDGSNCKNCIKKICRKHFNLP